MPSSACDWSSDVCSSDRSEEHTSELQSRSDLVCRLLLEKKKNATNRLDQTTHRKSDVRPGTKTISRRTRTPVKNKSRNPPTIDALSALRLTCGTSTADEE